MRASEFIREEDKLKEVMPLIGAAAKAGAGIARAGAAAKTAVKTGGGMLPNKDQTMGAPDPDEEENLPQNAPTDHKRAQAVNRAKDQIIQPGANVKLPTDGTGGPEEFTISGMRGDDVEIENPNPAPGEPRKVVHKKDDIKRSMSL